MDKLCKSLLWSLSLLFSLDCYANWHNWYSNDSLSISYQKHQSGLIEIRAEAFYSNINRQAFLNLLEDTQNAANWLSNVESVTVLAKPSRAENIVMTQLNAPWPVRDRVMLTHSCHKKLSDSASKMFIRAVAKEKRTAYLPADLSKNSIFVTPIEGFWLLEEKGADLFITHQIYADPKGNIPQWLSNKTALKGVKTTFKNLTKQIYSKPYQGQNNFTTSSCLAFE